MVTCKVPSAPKPRKRKRTLFVLEALHNYEPGHVVGVYSTRRKAEKAQMNTGGEISASSMGNGRWMFTRTLEPRRAVGGTLCEIIGVREYKAYEALLVVEWLAERAKGYPTLPMIYMYGEHSEFGQRDV